MQSKSIQSSTNLGTGKSLDSPSRPRFNLGDRVYWFRVPTQDFGTVVEHFYGTEGSVQGLGWHYTIQLDPDSPSFTHCKTDCGFEADLALMHQQLGDPDAAD